MQTFAHLDPADAAGLRPVSEIITLEDGLVLGVDLYVSADDAFAKACIPCKASVAAGMLYDPKTEQFSQPQAPQPTVPSSVSKAQAKIALLRAGHLDMVKTAVGANPEAEIWFEDATVWERQNPYVIDLGEKLLGGPDVIDQLFIAAAQITA